MSAPRAGAYELSEIQLFMKRYGGIAKAEAKAREHPLYGPEIRLLDRRIDYPAPDEERGDLIELRRRLVVAALVPRLEDGELVEAQPPKTDDRYGKEYAGAAVEEVVRLASAEQAQGKRLGRTLRNTLAATVGVTTYEVDLIFWLMEHNLLADAGREGWLKVADELSATPSFINLHELKTRL
jgi:hypothetical protein